MGKLLDAGDTNLWDSFNADLVELSGTDVKLYVVRQDQSRDTLYGEPAQFVYDGPYEIVVVLRGPDREVVVSDRGNERIQITQVWFSRAHLEDRECPMPKEGDVIEFWGGQYDLENVKDEYHVPVGEPMPQVGGGPWPIQFMMNAKRRERFLPERKTSGVVDGDTM